MPRSTTADLTVSGGETACMHLDTTAKFFRALSDPTRLKLLEFILAGASAVQVGTATFSNPYAPLEVLEGIEDYCRENQVASLTDLVGAALPRD